MKYKISVTKSSMPPLEEYIEEIRELWDTHILTNMGAKHKALETALKDYLQVENISLMSNGHMALELAIQAMGLRGEVITTPFTFASTTHAIVRNGLKPVFCDIDPQTYTIDANKIEALVTDNTSAIVPVHVYGNICNVEKIQDIADRYGLKVIYDAAHAFGETYKGIGIGNFGDAAMLSFHATKSFNTIEGGAVCFKDELLGLDLYRLKNFGIRNPEKVDYVGANAKMNEFQAAMGLCNLRHIEQEIEKRQKVYLRYQQNLQNTPGLQLNKLDKDTRYNYTYFPVVVEKEKFGIGRDMLQKVLQDEGIYSRKYFYPITSDYDCYHGMFDSSLTPIAQYISESVLTLPIYADLPIEAVDEICRVVVGQKR